MKENNETDKRIEELEAKLLLTHNELVKALNANVKLREEIRDIALKLERMMP